MSRLGSWWSRLSRRGKVVVIVVVVLLLAAAGASGNTSKANPNASAAAVASQPSAAVTPAPTQAAATPAPTQAAAVTLLSLTGNGIKTSKSFSATGDSVDVVYTFNCASFGQTGNFQIMFYGASPFGPTMPDILANALALKGGDTTTEYLNGASGPFHVEINSECAWAVKVVGTR